ncbi:hypothetical protein MSAN_00493400 [Mycena sanguinolenta]|uniref:Uncharacterized protein n=1 Tax=Mycena sanguinolenta TaxID=230812 RepID=A0A8H6Z5D2_9AGAR|nr:hypothetical protein MSAN_00493400 [Mycena sanguinolenta]
MSSSSVTSVAPGPTLSLCAQTCLSAADEATAACPVVLAGCVPCDNTNNTLSDLFSCVQGECQAAELSDARQYVASVCGIRISSLSTATIPFLPSNSNADINVEVPSTHSSVEASSVTRQTTSSVFSSPTVSSTGTSTQTVHSSTNTNSATPTSQTTVHSNPRTAAIAASVVTTLVVLTLAIVLFRIRRHKMHIRDHRIPDQFLDSQDHRAQIVPAKAVSIPTVLEAADSEVARSNSQDGAVLDEAQGKEALPTSPEADAEHVPLADSQLATPAENAPAQSDPPRPPEAGRDEETMSLRIRRLEARFEALLAATLPEGSPPSYYG